MRQYETFNEWDLFVHSFRQVAGVPERACTSEGFWESAALRGPPISGG